jgi:hypothetical protein
MQWGREAQSNILLLISGLSSFFLMPNWKNPLPEPIFGFHRQFRAHSSYFMAKAQRATSFFGLNYDGLSFYSERSFPCMVRIGATPENMIS